MNNISINDRIKLINIELIGRDIMTMTDPKEIVDGVREASKIIMKLDNSSLAETIAKYYLNGLNSIKPEPGSIDWDVVAECEIVIIDTLYELRKAA